MFKQGISREGDILDIGVQLEFIKKSGSFYSYGDLRLGQGRETSKNWLRDNEELSLEIESAIRDYYNDAAPNKTKTPE